MRPLLLAFLLPLGAMAAPTLVRLPCEMYFVSLSHDGAVMVGNESFGQASPDDPSGFYPLKIEPRIWTATNGLQPLFGPYDGVVTYRVSSVSADGNSILAEFAHVDPAVDPRYGSLIWNRSGSFELWDAVTYPGIISSNRDGTEIFRGGQIFERSTHASLLDGDYYAVAISEDGEVLAGFSWIFDRKTGSTWTLQEFDEPVTALDPTLNVSALSRDGRMVVGYEGDSFWGWYAGAKAFRWTPQKGVEYLDYGSAFTTDRTFVGYATCFGQVLSASYIVDADYEHEHYGIYDDVHGFRPIATVLADAGIDMGDWDDVGRLASISEDGNVLVGVGTYEGQPATWIASGLHLGACLLDTPASARADSDGDGLCNLLEYAFDTDPDYAGSVAQPTVAVRDGHAELSFRRRPSPDDLVYTVEASSDLEQWVSGDAETELVSTVPQPDFTDLVTVRDRLSTGRFLRLRVTRP